MTVIYYTIVVFALIGLLNPVLCEDQIKDARIQMIKECQDKTGASDADIEALRSRKAPESKAGVCMFECIFDKAEVMKDGKFNEKGLVTALTPLMAGDETKIAKLQEMAATCGKQISDSSDKCETAQKLMHCTVEEGKKFGFEYPNDF